jgi:hypothetical protein
MKLHLGYGVAAVGYMFGIFLLSSVPEGGRGTPEPLLFGDLLHVPLFAALASCLLLSVNNGEWRRRIPASLYVAIAVVGATYAGFAEWHQAGVMGRNATLTDFVLNLTGIAGLLLLHRFARRPGASS